MSNKLPKRSILGTRVSAPWSDGLYYGGMIDSSSEQPNGQVIYNVAFDDGYSKSYFPCDIIGPGFSSICSTKLKYKQKVYLTRAGREVKGFVTKHSKLTDEVFIEIHSPEGIIDATRKIDELRLLESRKSARLQENDDQDFAKVQLGEARKRKGMDIPRRSRNVSSGDESAVTHVEHMAALVLTSLSCSPQSPGFPDHEGTGSNVCRAGSPPSPPHNRSSSSASGVFSTSAPAYQYQVSRSIDEGIDVEMGSLSMRERGSPTRYQCTWKGCGLITAGCQQIEKHIRDSHLGRKSNSGTDFHEEEFYYTPLEEDEPDISSMADDLDIAHSPPKKFSASSSAVGVPIVGPAPRYRFNPGPPTTDHDYLKREAVPPLMSTLNGMRSMSVPSKLTSPISIPPKSSAGQHFFAAKPLPYARKVSPGSPSISASSPKSPSAGSVLSAFGATRKSRSDIKKCRKIYGMENHDKWCTQCKWKKACTRFPNE